MRRGSQICNVLSLFFDVGVSQMEVDGLGVPPGGFHGLFHIGTIGVHMCNTSKIANIFQDFYA